MHCVAGLVGCMLTDGINDAKVAVLTAKCSVRTLAGS